ncbi:worker-enriched antennal transcript isoform X1 [Ptiloglossa arizonensis]|uniref:worker-enriched antennal transcript isoform X1 n=2 Tax=Ptiloglossa arizonensis TaxID=3350558 RepID=UPI003FA02CBC
MSLLQRILLGFVFAMLAVASAQDYSQLFAGFGPYLGQSVGMRDPRSNRGPVLFPPGPPPNSADTSGVVAGASGYGFVPPNPAFYRYFYY